MITISKAVDRYFRNHGVKTVVERKGHQMPLSDARRIALLARKQRRRKTNAYIPTPGITRRVFPMTRGETTLFSNGDARVGCQYIKWEEINDLAKRKGWFKRKAKKS